MLAAAVAACGDPQRPAVAGPALADALADATPPADVAAGPDQPAQADPGVDADTAAPTDAPPEVAADAAPALPCKTNADCLVAAEPCTEARCEAKAGQCKVVLAADGAPCSDNNPCTVNDTCLAGQCVAGKSGCGCTKDGDCSSFDDGNACNGTWGCDLANLPALCAPKKATQVVCPPSTSPCVALLCNPTTGACDPTPTNDGAACEDGKVCTSGAMIHRQKKVLNPWRSN
ncbi:MAG: hypothetical protein FJ100_19170 [Deltaproteobacteria bacterium]|nr:hypothetical protein [Deltaproteobacteria bacterium]